MHTDHVNPKKKSVDQESDFEVHIRNYESSGMKMKSYCEANHIKYSWFYYHFKKSKINPDRSSLQPSILPLQIASLQQNQEISSGLFAEVHGIKLFQAVAPDYLLALLNR